MTDLSMIAVKESAKYFYGRLVESVTKKSDDWVVKSLAEASQVANCVAVALLSLKLQRQPFDDEVQDLLGKLIDDPSASARVRRLLGEMLMSPSRKRRARLAAVFVAGPTISPTAGDRDRLDILVEGMLDDDVEGLGQLLEFESKHMLGCTPATSLLMEQPERQAAGSSRRHFCSLSFLNGTAGSRLAWSDLPTLSTIVVDNLEALGVIRSLGGFSQGVQLASGFEIFIPYFVTALGRFLEASLEHEAIRKGMADAGAE